MWNKFIFSKCVVSRKEALFDFDREQISLIALSSSMSFYLFLYTFEMFIGWLWITLERKRWICEPLPLDHLDKQKNWCLMRESANQGSPFWIRSDETVNPFTLGCSSYPATLQQKLCPLKVFVKCGSTPLLLRSCQFLLRALALQVRSSHCPLVPPPRPVVLCPRHANFFHSKIYSVHFCKPNHLTLTWT